MVDSGGGKGGCILGYILWWILGVESVVAFQGRKCGCILGYILWWIQGWKVWLYSRVYSMVDSGGGKGGCIPG